MACLLSGALLLEDTGHVGGRGRRARRVAAALLDPAHHTPDLGGVATTTDVSAAVLEEMENLR